MVKMDPLIFRLRIEYINCINTKRQMQVIYIIFPLILFPCHYILLHRSLTIRRFPLAVVDQFHIHIYLHAMCTTHSLVVHFTLPEGLLLSLYNIPPGLLLVSLVCRCATRPFKIYSPVPLESIENVERWMEKRRWTSFSTYIHAFTYMLYAYVCVLFARV